MKKTLLLPLYILLLGLFVIWSYALTDRNLIIIQWEPYLSFQNWIWSLTPSVVTTIYMVLTTAMLLVYFKIVKSNLKFSFALLPLMFVFGYNALSHDIFNYMFNAKMVLAYQTNPHIHSAIEFASDPWLRFMHNVHTPAPYFYGWTALSLLPSIMGLGKFLTIWLSFKLFSALGWLLLIWTQRQLLIKLKMPAQHWWEFVFHPLVLIELLVVSHNDGWMMALALLSFLVLMQTPKISVQKIVLSLGFLLLSASIKYVTLILLPVWLVILLKQKEKFPELPFQKIIEKYPFELAAVLLFLPLFTARSQWFHPWYLVWSLSFLPFIKLKWLKVFLLSFSISSLYRYIPWMWNGAFEYTDLIIRQEILITWLGGLVLAAIWLGWLHYQDKAHLKS